MEGILIGFIYTFLISLSFETVFSRILRQGNKHPGKKIIVLAIQSFVITWMLFQMYT
ncbi:hypothetical protein KUV80_13930 [Fictibacillus nanhaiensis]|uniref:hypothetical protein n=1 Tax=Fictibacillus nanhaiensis TaxID=742169 RepID=UPI001C95C11D|nr:hypothetical protein [Fictibacillus nanhaiensis]MBY6037766.1 hypothetical protein [Fictibacillus nanhaiensis]